MGERIYREKREKLKIGETEMGERMWTGEETTVKDTKDNRQ